MKKLIICIVSLISTVSLGEDLLRKFDKLSPNDIFKRGYAIEATITQKPGIHFLKGTSVYSGEHCHIFLKEAVKDNSILKQGQKILLTHNDNPDHILRTSSGAVKYIMHPLPDWRSPHPFEKVKLMCEEFLSFRVIENDLLANIDIEADQK